MSKAALKADSKMLFWRSLNCLYVS